jgi:hypothetical protein
MSALPATILADVSNKLTEDEHPYQIFIWNSDFIYFSHYFKIFEMNFQPFLWNLNRPPAYKCQKEKNGNLIKCMKLF